MTFMYGQMLHVLTSFYLMYTLTFLLVYSTNDFKYYLNKKDGNVLSVGQSDGAWRRTNKSQSNLSGNVITLCRHPADSYVTVRPKPTHANLH